MPDHDPFISVVLPFRNADATLAGAMESIHRQTWTRMEVIAVDDGSTDNSARIAADFVRTDPRFRVITLEQKGIVAALQVGCTAARGAYIARMDGDDWAAPTRIARQAALMEADPRLGLTGTLVRVFGSAVGTGRRRYEAWLNELTDHDAITRDRFIECPIAHPTFMMRREAYDAVGGYEDHEWAEDYDLLLRLWSAGWRLGKAPETLLHWRDTSGRLSMNDPRYSPARFRAAKRRFLLPWMLSQGRPFVQWGAGRAGKPWLREWPPERRPAFAIDVHPRKIGKTIHGCPVKGWDALPAPGAAFIAVAVGAVGARETIRAWCVDNGYAEGRDFLFLA